MIRSNNDEALRNCGKRLPLISVIALALMFGGCTAQSEPAVYANATEETVSLSAAEELLASEATAAPKTVSETAAAATTSKTAVTTAASISETPITTTVPTEDTDDDELMNTAIGSYIPAVAVTAAEAETETEVQTAVQTSAQAEVQTTAPAVTAPVSSAAETQAASVQQTAVQTSAAQTAATQAPSTEYSKDFFANDLFIGDSISTGYSLYGFLPEKNVYAKVGLNPSTVLTRSVSTCYGEIGITDMLAYTSPERVYIMLGSNGVQWLSIANMLDSTDVLTELIKEQCPDAEVIIVSVPPVTPEYDATVDDVNVMAKINEYNDGLSAYCRAKGMLYIDIGTVLKNEYGYFDYSYAERDGMHFKSAAYKVLLSKIQSDVTDYLDYKEQAALRKAQEANEGEGTSVTDVTEISETSESFSVSEASEAVTTVSETSETAAVTTVPETTAAHTTTATQITGTKKVTAAQTSQTQTPSTAKITVTEAETAASTTTAASESAPQVSETSAAKTAKTTKATVNKNADN